MIDHTALLFTEVRGGAGEDSTAIRQNDTLRIRQV